MLSTNTLVFTSMHANGKHELEVNQCTIQVTEDCLKAILELAIAHKEPQDSEVLFSPQMARSVKSHLGDDAIAGYRDCYELNGKWKIKYQPSFRLVAKKILTREYLQKYKSQTRKGRLIELLEKAGKIYSHGKLIVVGAVVIAGIAFSLTDEGFKVFEKINPPAQSEIVQEPKRIEVSGKEKPLQPNQQVNFESSEQKR